MRANLILFCALVPLMSGCGGEATDSNADPYRPNASVESVGDCPTSFRDSAWNRINNRSLKYSTRAAVEQSLMVDLTSALGDPDRRIQLESSMDFVWIHGVDRRSIAEDCSGEVRVKFMTKYFLLRVRSDHMGQKTSCVVELRTFESARARPDPFAHNGYLPFLSGETECSEWIKGAQIQPSLD